MAEPRYRFGGGQGLETVAAVSGPARFGRLVGNHEPSMNLTGVIVNLSGVFFSVPEYNPRNQTTQNPRMEPKHVRETLGLSVTEMARLCGIHYMTWSKWEKGEQSPPAIARRMFDLLLWLHGRGLIQQAIQGLDDTEK
jgi:DNA-binding transcriptional regulator YiaG